MSVVSLALGLLAPLSAAAQEPAAPFPAAAPEDHGLSWEGLEELAELVERLAFADKVVGAELLVIRNGRSLLHRTAGWADREAERRMAPGTVFNIRSMTKPLVGAAAQILIDEGRLALDDPVAKHLPSFGEGDAAEITVAHLLTHRSGLPDGNPPGRPEDYGSLRAVADHWAGHGPSEGAPGAAFRYSDPGADVLGAVVAAASGQPLADFVRARLFEPLGMADSFAMTGAARARHSRLATQYRMTAQGWRPYWKPGDPPLAPFVLGSGTTWYSTPQDYARFLSMLAAGGVWEGERILSKAAVARVLTPVSDMPEYSNGLPGTRVRYGQMMQLYVPLEGPADQVVAFGHSGSDGTYSWVWPGRELVVLYFTQSRGQATRVVLELMLPRALSPLREPAAPPPAPGRPPAPVR